MKNKRINDNIFFLLFGIKRSELMSINVSEQATSITKNRGREPELNTFLREIYWQFPEVDQMMLQLHQAYQQSKGLR